jgi:preprotein translocase subunit YajC
MMIAAAAFNAAAFDAAAFGAASLEVAAFDAAALGAALAQGQTGGGMTILLLQFLAIGLVFYFLILRPQSQARKRHQEMLSNLKKGDEVMTAGGLIGKVRDIKEVEVGTAKETRVTLETGTATVIVERSRIVRIGTEAAPAAAAPGVGAGATRT